MISLFDTHCHIQVIGLDDPSHTAAIWNKSGLSMDEVLKNSKDAKVNELMVVGCDLTESREAINLAKKETKIYASIGIHPHEADKYALDKEKLDEFSKLAKDTAVKAVGECGLDYYYSHSIKKNQIRLLEFQLDLALNNNLPIIFHVRDAYDDFWPIYKNQVKSSNVKAVLHSYTDSKKNLAIALKNGLYIGVNGIATFTKDSDQIEMYRSIPLENLVLETDAPYLTPVPYRGKVNEPKNVAVVAKFLADLRGLSLEELASATTINARKLFNI